MSIPAISPYALPVSSTLPKNKVFWKADPKRSALLIHDMQQYFLNAYKKDQPPVSEVINNIQLLKQHCVRLGIPIVYTAQPGSQDHEDRALLWDFWGPGLDDDTAQTKIIDQIAPRESDILLTKWRYSAFKRTNLRQLMRRQGRNQLIVCGVYAHIGCLLTASDAFMQDIEAFLIADAVADFSLEHHTMALTYAANNCAVVTSASLLLDQLTAHEGEKEKDEAQSLTLSLVRRQVAEILGEALSEDQDHEDLLDKGLDSIRIMSLLGKWRAGGADVTFVKLAKQPTVSAWWRLLSPQ